MKKNDHQAHEMTMRYPATRWQDALPTGSGIVGALMYGQIHHDTITLNHDALYYPKKKAQLLDVSDQLPEVRRLISAAKYDEAAELMPKVHAQRSKGESGSTSSLRDPYQPLCSILLGTETVGPFRGYRRGVDFSTGRVWIQWTDDGGTFTREAFVSRGSDTVFVRIRGGRPGSVSYRIAVGEARDEQANTTTWAGSGDVAFTVTHREAAPDHVLTFAAHYSTGLSFGAACGVEAKGGQIHVEGTELIVEGSDEVILRARLFVGEKPEVVLPGLVAACADTSASFDAAFAEHADLHGRLFGGMNLDLAAPDRPSNEEMLLCAYDGEVPNALIQTMFEYGRYLLICSSRPGGWPANLQGIWNGDYSPAWNSDYHTDENVQMNYWPALAGGLDEAALPLFDYFEKWIDDYRENARKIYGCRGILMPIAQTTHGLDVPCIWSNWTSAAGWIGQHFYDYYLFTGNLEFLRNRAVPWLREVALFYEDFLIEGEGQGEGGELLFSPSLSPENKPTGDDMGLLTMNATMDVAVCREVLGNLCSACELLGIEGEGIDRWRGMLARLPKYAVNDDGAIMEWLHPSFKDNYHHRHQSHLYPLFPGMEITEETHPELYEACRVAVEKRLVIGLTSQTGWSMAHMANIYARLGMGNRALECLELLSRSSLGPNLFTYHNDWRDMGLTLTWDNNPPFQIDANFGIAAAVLEMLAFSKPGLIKLLPALPDAWATGRVSGIRCRGGITVGMQWDREKRGFAATLTSTTDQNLLLRLPKDLGGVEFRPAATQSVEHGEGYWNVALTKDADLTVEARSS